jgi:hypothetical protein
MKIRHVVLLGALLTSAFCFAQSEKLQTRSGISRHYSGHRGTAEDLSTIRIRAVRVHHLPHWLPFNQKWLSVPMQVNMHIVGRHSNGRIFADRWIHNLRTTGGADWQALAMASTSTPPATVNYIALSNNSTPPAAGDCAAGSSTCTLTGEIATNGLNRHQGTFAHTNSTATWTLAWTWTATGTQSVQEAGMFNASSSGTMVFEASFSQVNLVNTDTLTVTWTVSY